MMTFRPVLAFAALALIAAAPPPPAAPEPAAPPSAPPADDGGRVVGGHNAVEGTTPWQAEFGVTYVYTDADVAADAALPDSSLNKRFLDGKQQWERAHRCGGVLIATGWVLTAAHCVQEVIDNKLDITTARQVRLGTQDLAVPSPPFRITRAIIHAKYNVGGHVENDVALLAVVPATPLTPEQSAAMRAIRILGSVPGDRPLAPHDVVLVTGWGFTTARREGAITGLTTRGDVIRAQVNHSVGADGRADRNSAMLQEVGLTVFAPTTCAAVPDYRNALDAGKFCAGGKPGHDSCNGDSGGPVTRAQGSERVLVGLVSFGVGCAVPGVPGVFVDVRHFADWIERAKATPPAAAPLGVTRLE